MAKAKKAKPPAEEPEGALDERDETKFDIPRSIAGKRQLLRKLLTKETCRALYQVGPLLGKESCERLGLTIPSRVYIEDPTSDQELEEVEVRWDPSVGDGPTSSRFVVVDYNVDTGAVESPAIWDADQFTFLDCKGGKPVAPAGEEASTPQFRQVHAWVKAQHLLEFCETHLGRPIPWGFEGNRLMIVPAAGLQNNAFYDRESKSLQLYFFQEREKQGEGVAGAQRGYCALAHDIVTHEAGHAILDGLRPLYLECSSWETEAFHEFFGDMVAILTTIRSNFARKYLGINLTAADFLPGIARQFGEATDGKPFLRSAVNEKTFAEAAADREPHRASEVLTGAVFDVLAQLAAQYLSPVRQAKRPASASQALAWAAQRIPSMALQPIDLLPPVDVRFADYLAAMLRNDEIVNTADPDGYRPMIRALFKDKRGLEPTAIDLPDLEYFPNVDEASRSNAAAYRLINDNRKPLGIPPNRDLIVLPPYDCLKSDAASNRLPRQIVFQYRWEETIELPLEPRFGAFGGRQVGLPCGGTLVFDDQNNLLSFMGKPGTDHPVPTEKEKADKRRKKLNERHERLAAEGKRRRDELIDHLADVIGRRRLAFAEDPAAGLARGHLGVLVRQEGDRLRFESAPHLCSEEEPWTTSF